MSSWTKVQGDVNDTLTATLSGVENLTTVTAVEAHVWRGATIVTLTATVADATLRTILVQLGGAAGWLATAAPGKWSIEFECTFASGAIFTWPANSADFVMVRTQGD